MGAGREELDIYQQRTLHPPRENSLSSYPKYASFETFPRPPSMPYGTNAEERLNCTKTRFVLTNGLIVCQTNFQWSFGIIKKLITVKPNEEYPPRVH